MYDVNQCMVSSTVHGTYLIGVNLCMMSVPCVVVIVVIIRIIIIC